VISTPRLGTRQKGVDVAAVGPDGDDGGERKYFAFVIKRGDIGRSDWDDGPQSIRQSLNEVRDSYIPQRIAEEYRSLPVVVCVCIGGELREDVQDQWAGYVSGNTEEGLCFRLWNGDRLADLLLKGVLRRELVQAEVRSDFEKAVAMVAHPEVSYGFFRRTTDGLLGGALEDRHGTTRLRQVYIALWVLFVWSRSAGNLEAAYRASEYAMVRMWGYCRAATMQGPLPDAPATVLDETLAVHLDIAGELLDGKVKAYSERPFALSAAVRSQSPVDVNLALFEVLGRICLTGLWWHWRASISEDEEAQGSLAKRDRLMRMAVSTINSNPALASPICDDFAIEIALFMLLAQGCGAVENVGSYILKIVDRVAFSVSHGGAYPTVAVGYHELVGHPATGSEDYFRENTRWSILYPLLVAWLDRFGAADVRDAFVAFLGERLSHTTQQVWMPDEVTDDLLWEGGREHGVGIPCTPLYEGSRRYSTFLDQVASDHPAFEELSTTRQGLWPIFLAACRHFRMPVPPQLWFIDNDAT